jgi:hypothetical protein
MLRALVFSFGSSDGGLVIDEREKRSICIKQTLYSRTQKKVDESGDDSYLLWKSSGLTCFRYRTSLKVE